MKEDGGKQKAEGADARSAKVQIYGYPFILRHSPFTF
jgi:hypothetical protein